MSKKYSSRHFQKKRVPLFLVTVTVTMLKQAAEVHTLLCHKGNREMIVALLFTYFLAVQFKITSPSVTANLIISFLFLFLFPQSFTDEIEELNR